MKTKYNLLVVFASALLLWQCEISVDEFKPAAGTVDFSSFVVVGDSYSAGYTDGALSAFGQDNGFAAIMAQQIQTVGSTDFKQPMLPEGQSVGSSLNGSYKLVIVNGSLAPVPTAGNPDLLLNPATWINGDGPFQNVGVPGAKSFHCLTPLYGDPSQGVGNFNPFYSRFASNPGTSTMLGDAMLSIPTFFSFWMAGNDVLGYALAGGEGNVGIGSDDYTPVAVFESSMRAAVNTLSSNEAKGVIGNIPGIDALPYFSYIAYNALVIDAATAGLLNAAYAQYNVYAQIYGVPQMVFAEGPNAFVMADVSHPLGMRQMKAGEKVLLSASSGIQGEVGWGSKSPMPEDQTLDEVEISNIRTATSAFNTIIKTIATEKGLAFVDANKIMDQLLNQGMMIDGSGYSAGFITGGVFSLDGIHACGKGSAIIANAFIEAINKQYGSSIPLANVNDYPGVAFP